MANLIGIYNIVKINEAIIEYSVDGLIGWHVERNEQDKYWRVSIDGGTTWLTSLLSI